MHVFRRMVLLVLRGIVYNGGLALAGWSSTHFASVLGNIGIAYFFAAVIAMNCRPRWQVLWLLAILLAIGRRSPGFPCRVWERECSRPKGI